MQKLVMGVRVQFSDGGANKNSDGVVSENLSDGVVSEKSSDE